MEELSERLQVIEMRLYHTLEEMQEIGRNLGDSPNYGMTPTTPYCSSGSLDRLYDDIQQGRLPINGLRDEEVCIIGPGEGLENDVSYFHELFPEVLAIHVVDKAESVFIRVDESLRGLSSIPKAYGYRTNCLILPQELAGRMGLVFDAGVIDGYHTEAMERRFAKEVERVLKPGGLHVFIPADYSGSIHDGSCMEDIFSCHDYTYSIRR